MNNELVKKISSWFLIIIYSILLIVSVIHNTSFASNEVFEVLYSYVLLGSMPIIFFYILIYRHISIKETIFSLFLCVFLIFSLAKNAANIEPYILLLLIFAFREHKPETLCKVYLFVVTIAILFLCLLSYFGVLDFVVIGSGTERIRHSFVFNHPNLLGFYFVSITLCLYYLINKNMYTCLGSIVFTATCLILAWFVIYYVDSRMSGICLIVILGFFICRLLSVKIVRFLPSSITRLLGKIFSSLFISSLIIFFVLEIAITILYTGDVPFFNYLNSFLSTRLELQHQAFINYGIALFGESISFSMSSVGYSVVDSGYILFIYNYGLFIEVAFIILITFFIAKKYTFSRNGYYLDIFFVIALSGIVENHFYRLGYMPFLIMLFTLPSNNKLSKFY